MSQIRITGIPDIKRVLNEIAPREAINLMRATTADLAKGLAEDARANSPADEGDMIRGIKHKRARGTRTTVKAEVVANTNGKSFYWRFREYGQGPDGREDAMFLRALMGAQSTLDQRYLKSFTDKLTSRLARKSKG